LHDGEKLLLAGLGSALLGIVFYCAGNALTGHDHLPFMTPGTGGGIIATGILMWLSGAILLSVEH
jgi:hypothetical protein